MSQKGIIQATAPAKCDLCGRLKELRPYGPNGEDVCFDCAQKDPEAMKRGFNRLVMGEGNA